MSDFVGYDTTQNDRDLKLGVITSRETRHIIVVDAGQDWDNCKTEGSVFELIRFRLGEQAQGDVGTFERLPAGILSDNCGLPQWAVYPDHIQASLTENSTSFVFGLGYCGGCGFRIVGGAHPDCGTSVYGKSGRSMYAGEAQYNKQACREVEAQRKRM